MDLEKLVQDQIKVCRDTEAGVTKIALVLFAALIVSWLGMWDHLVSYREAILARRPAQHVAEVFQAENERKRAIIEELSARSRLPDEPQSADFAWLAEAIRKQKAQSRPWQPVLTQLRSARGDVTSTRRAEMLAAVISEVSLYAKNVTEKFDAEKRPVEKTPFKLLGLDFSVNGLWAWLVWLFFFDSGVVLLWFGRRTTIAKRRFMWSPAVGAAPFSGVDGWPDGVPAWSHPLPYEEEWVTLLSRGFLGDVAYDPLSGLCVALLLVDFGLAVAVVRMGIISTPLLTIGRLPGIAALSHGVLLCILYGTCLGIALSWLLSFVRNRSANVPTKSQRAMDRRAWLGVCLGTFTTAVLYSDPISRKLKRIVLRPRYKKNATSVRHPSGFWEASGVVYWVPPEGRSKALKQLHGKKLNRVTDLDRVQIATVHQSAVVPFVRARVKVLVDQHQYIGAFAVVQEAVVNTSIRPAPSKMPNLQLYDLLGAIARRAGDSKLLEKASTMLANAEVTQEETQRPPQPIVDVHESSQQVGHSRHASRKHRSSSIKKRLRRLFRFKFTRLPNEFRAKIKCLASAEGLNVPEATGSWSRLTYNRSIVRNRGSRPPFSRGRIRLATGRHLLMKDPASSAEDVRSSRTETSCGY